MEPVNLTLALMVSSTTANGAKGAHHNVPPAKISQANVSSATVASSSTPRLMNANVRKAPISIEVSV